MYISSIVPKPFWAYKVFACLVVIENKRIRATIFMTLLVCILAFGKNFEVVARNQITVPDSITDAYDIFDFKEPVVCTLKFDIRKFTKEKLDEEKIPAIFSYHPNDSTTIIREITIEARGQSRKEICYFPPIKLKLKETTFGDPYLDQVKNQKLVTHCKTSKNFEQYLLKEYLCYELFNLLTDKSFRVQLLQMNYIDSKDKIKPITRYAFLIEDAEILCKRNNCIEIEFDKLGMMHIDTSSMIQFSLFQYMIGNVDWSIAGLHNIKLMKSKDFAKPMPFVVPYDFDHAGFVNASYAVNVRDPEVTSVKTRVFDGMCFTEEDYANETEKFLQLKDKFFARINNLDQLKPGTKKDLISYLEKFYKLIERPNFYKIYVTPNCRKSYN